MPWANTIAHLEPAAALPVRALIAAGRVCQLNLPTYNTHAKLVMVPRAQCFVDIRVRGHRHRFLTSATDVNQRVVHKYITPINAVLVRSVAIYKQTSLCGHIGRGAAT